GIPARSERQAMDWSLVLTSQGIEVIPEEGGVDGPGWLLRVPESDRERALGLIRQWRAENRGWHWRREIPASRLEFHAGALLWVFALVVVHAARPLFAQLRRYTLAGLGAAETAATFAGILYSDAPAGGEAEAIEPMEPISLERQSLLTMPSGWRMEQLKSEQPTATYEMFKREILNEIARSVCVPYNVAAGNSSGYNYASGRLDHQVYHRAVDVEREVIRRTILEPLLAAWINEAVLIEDAIPPRYRSLPTIPHAWMWPAWPHVDPSKEAAATSMRLASGTTTYAEEYAAAGKDWEAEFRQRARELALAEELGVPIVVPNMQDFAEAAEQQDEQATDADEEDDE
ncbi:MAG: phage portal protein, partial [Phycisphaerales bacterium]